MTESSDALIDLVRNSVIGSGVAVDGPFGPRPVIYADYTASGRSLSFIEDYIRDVVLPLYANTHTESSGTGRQTTRFREDARAAIRRCTGASEEHAVVFCGSGSTFAINRLISVMGLLAPSSYDAWVRTRPLDDADRPVVFIGPYEHHSNELPWRESIADVVTIDEDADGHVDLDKLDAELVRYSDRPLLIGSFSAASNVTGILTDSAAVSSLLHSHGALAFWDFAAAAPYVAIEMGTAAGGALDYYDAVFLSPHKLIGGPGTPGVLVARRELFDNEVPVVPGGGTVAYVNPTEHDYLTDIEQREEGGTPAIVESIRAGLVFGLKEAVGVKAIRAMEERFVSRAVRAWSEHPEIDVLGNRDAERLSIVSFVLRHGDGYLHHNFVVALLNDLFGVQSRGGCSCAGPYGHRLLGIDIERSHEFEREITRGCEGIKPGWIRVNFNYFIDEATFDYIVEAVRMVATHGALLLPNYRFEPDSGLWTHRNAQFEAPMSLDDISYETGEMSYHHRDHYEVADRLDHYIDLARSVFEAARTSPVGALDAPDTSDDFEHLRWFPYPAEVGVVEATE